MNLRKIAALWTTEPQGAHSEGMTSNMRLLLIAAAFLSVTIGLILMQPGFEPNTAQQAALGTPASIQTEVGTTENPQQSEVTRSSTSLLTLADNGLPQDISKMIRNPIRLGGDFRDLHSISKTTLDSFGHYAGPGDPLYDLLVQALAEGQSNAYIDALLNTAAGRGDFDVPVSLRTVSGRLDTNALLHELAALITQ